MNVYLLFHKCASQWVRPVFSELQTGHEFLFKDREEVHELPPQTVGMWENLDVRDERFAHLVDPERSRAAMIVRDPRDILISAYNSHKKTHPVVKAWVGFEEQRQRLNSASFEDGLVMTMDFLHGLFIQLNSAVQSGARIFFFEDVISRPKDLVRDLLGTWNITAPNIPEVVAKYSFENLSNGRVRTGNFPPGHYRRGTSGEWKDVLSEQVLREFRARHGELLGTYDALKESASGPAT